jgi:hypothetical protein
MQAVFYFFDRTLDMARAQKKRRESQTHGALIAATTFSLKTFLDTFQV